MPASPDGGSTGDLSTPVPSGAGVPGRTRPIFEELPPGPPTWPGWTAIGVGVMALILGLGAAGLAATPAGSPGAGLVAGIVALAGALLVLIGLVWLAIAGILRRRILPEGRYRGGSVIVLFLIVVVGAPLVALPVLLALLRGDIGRINDPVVVSAELLLTPLAFFVVLGLFVALPRALPGLRLWNGRGPLLELVIGLLLGAVAWAGIQLLGAAIAWILSLLGLQVGGEQEVTGLTQEVPFAVAVIAVGVLAPLAEEGFFRGLVFNAWEREHGTRRALLGSAVLFALAHVPGGTVLAVALVFVLGLLLAGVYARVRSLATTVGIHACFNTLTLVVLFFASGR